MTAPCTSGADTSGAFGHPSSVQVKPTAWHWPEYLIEAWALGTFMVSAVAFTVLLEHPASPVRQSLQNGDLRRLLMGCAMGVTAIALIYSRLGARSGAHMNPAVTLTFARLGKIAPRDAVAYAVFQFLGATAGLVLARSLFTTSIGHPAVNYAATLPGPLGPGVAFVAEVAIALCQMSLVLWMSNGRYMRFTGLAAGTMVGVYIFVEAPLSGMSLNPARSFAPALLSGGLSTLWIYFAAPCLGMTLAAALFTRRRGLRAVLCAKLNHAGPGPCIFCQTPAAPAARAAL